MTCDDSYGIKPHIIQQLAIFCRGVLNSKLPVHKLRNVYIGLTTNVYFKWASACIKQRKTVLTEKFPAPMTPTSTLPLALDCGRLLSQYLVNKSPRLFDVEYRLD